MDRLAMLLIGLWGLAGVALLAISSVDTSFEIKRPSSRAFSLDRTLRGSERFLAAETNEHVGEERWTMLINAYRRVLECLYKAFGKIFGATKYREPIPVKTEFGRSFDMADKYPTEKTTSAEAILHIFVGGRKLWDFDELSEYVRACESTAKTRRDNDVYGVKALLEKENIQEKDLIEHINSRLDKKQKDDVATAERLRYGFMEYLVEQERDAKKLVPALNM
ncbi:hypothetical protein CCR75_004805 [Bremia lactucae]|uniref:Uncharacterized protein n=1 Tax=Bremia lactucae TaxID=4779 RepID=A0A976FJB2_BRELC|nr:hypothetical protein CCR75_004805 [Bremia lactucae]